MSGHVEAPSRAGPSPRERRLRYPPLLRRVFLVNAAVLAGASAVTVLALSPGIVSSEVALAELAILAGGLVAMLVVNLVLLRRAFRPLEELRDLVRRVDPLRPGQRVRAGGPASEATELAAAFNEMLERLEDERRESARQALEAQEAERLRVAQELHDEVGQSLTAVLLQLGRAQRLFPQDAADELAEARETARSSLDDVRRIARRLRPETLNDLGLGPALVEFCDRLSEGAAVSIVPAVAPTCPRSRERRSSSSTASPRRRSQTPSVTPRRTGSNSGSNAAPTASASGFATVAMASTASRGAGGSGVCASARCSSADSSRSPTTRRGAFR